MKPRRLGHDKLFRWHWMFLLGVWIAAPTAWAAEAKAPAAASPAPATNAPTANPVAADVRRRTNDAPATNAPATAAASPATNAAPAAAPATQAANAAPTPPPATTNAAPAAAATGTNAPEATASGTTTNAPKETAAAPLTPEQMFEGGADTYNNWIEFSAGGFLTRGNQAQMQAQQQRPAGASGGLEDFHYQGNLAKGTTFALDGRALFDNHDYKLRLDLTREKLGYLRFSYNQFRTWSNGDGGFYPPSGAYYPLGGDALALDRGDFSLEGGLTLENVPKVTFKYTHSYREGEKASTSWGLTHPDGGALVRGLAPSFHDLHEHGDSFQLDVTHQIKKVDFGVGLRYETGKLDDALVLNQFPGEPIAQNITDRQVTTYDLFNVHAFAESWLKKNLMVSAGFSYSDLDNDISGSRVYTSNFGPGAQSAFGFGYTNLSGGSRLHEYITDLSLFALPWKNLTIVPSVRILKQDTDADSAANETLGPYSPVPFGSRNDCTSLDVRERLDLRYSGLTNWVLYARGELTEGNGNLNETGGLIPIGGIGVPAVQQETEDTRLFQKYSAGARWYPTRRVSLDAGGYYKLNDYHYDNLVDSTPNNSFDRYPAYLVMQSFETYDGNLSLTLRPRLNLTLVSRYEFQWSRIYTKPDPVSGLSDVESSFMTSHILAQNVTWSPCPRLFLETDFNYVLSDARSPASAVTQAILDAQNDYWTLSFSSGLVLDDKTDLKLSYFYYQADNYQNNATVGLPLGTGDQEHGVTATLVRRLGKHLRWSLKYGFYHYDNVTFGGHRDYDAHLLYSSLQYRF